MRQSRLPPLYPIIDIRGPAAESGTQGSPEGALPLALRLARAGVSLLQLRAKMLASGALVETAELALQMLAPLGCRLIVNDRADVAKATGAAGVHLGQEDLPVEAARRILGPEALIGLSTHSLAEVRAAVGLPVDYLGFGPVFDSPTKAGVRAPRGLKHLAQACREAHAPVVAIGGVTIETAAACLQAGAASVAVISELERAGTDLEALVARYLALAAS